MKLQPQSARLLRDGVEVEVPLARVVVGDIVILRPGERVPVDGVVLSGVTSIDESLITGESLPVTRKPGDRIIGGSLNFDGALEYRATSIGSDSVLGQMMRLVEEAQSSRAPMQQLADRVSAVFVPVVLVLALATFFIWIFAGGGCRPRFCRFCRRTRHRLSLRHGTRGSRRPHRRHRTRRATRRALQRRRKPRAPCAR